MTVRAKTEQCPVDPSRAPGAWPVPMRVLDVSFSKPAENLAYDELLLDDAESGRAADTLRMWESETPFVVLGVSQVLREHVRVDACAKDGVRILRRCSAGGCVLQGPGCLNFTLVISHEHFPEIQTIRGSYCFVLNRLAVALKEAGVSASHKGISDLAWRGRKISGNAQRRRKRFILHHGTLLYGMDPELMERYLMEPVDRPQYRGDRTHRGFVRSLNLDSDAVRGVFRRAFGAETGSDKLRKDERDAIRELVKEKYANPQWTARR